MSWIDLRRGKRVRSVSFAAVAVICIGLPACDDMTSSQKPDTPEPTLSRSLAGQLATPQQVQSLILPSILALSNPEGFTTLPPALFPRVPLSVTRRPEEVTNTAFAKSTTEGDTCITISPLVFTDSDGDGVPKRIVVTFDCAYQSFSYSGTVEIADKNDRDRKSGWTVNTGVKYAYRQTAQGAFSGAMDMSIDVSPYGTSGYRAMYVGKGTVAGPSFKFTYDVDYVVTLTGTIRSGSINLNGDIAYSWSGDDLGSGKVALAISVKDVLYNTTCPTLIVAGIIEIRDRAGNVVVVRFTGCGQAVSTYNGEPI